MAYTQLPQATDVIASLSKRVSALENANANPNQPVDMFKSFNEVLYANDKFQISTHLYHVCGPNMICSTQLVL